MSHGYRLISWTPYKKRYDVVMLTAVVTYIATFFAAGRIVHTGAHAISDEILLIRALGTCAFSMLTFILCVGPLARLNPRFLPILYNRRHLGVCTFFVALAHAALVTGFYHGFGVVSPLRSLITSNTQYRSIAAFPFETLGLIALVILLAMAATSHDFWLNTLSQRIWKSLHMLVYVAWTLLVFHIVLGALQAERSNVYIGLVAVAVLVVGVLHIVAGRREMRVDQRIPPAKWVEACSIDDVQESRGKVVTIHGHERIALFRHQGTFRAVGNVCAHQGGPLAEGRIIDGCITCPWHGYQYRPEDGCSPPPFTEKVPTYPVRVEDGRVMVCTEANHVG